MKPKNLCLFLCLSLQVNYLNKSLDTFNTLMVYPIYYVLFTSVVLSTCIILFQEWRNMAAVDVVTILGAFLVIVVGVAMLHLFKDLQVAGPSPSTWMFLQLKFRSTLDGRLSQQMSDAHTVVQRINYFVSLNLGDVEGADQSAVPAGGKGGTCRTGYSQWSSSSRRRTEEPERGQIWTDGQHGDRESSSYERGGTESLHHQLEGRSHRFVFSAWTLLSRQIF